MCKNPILGVDYLAVDIDHSALDTKSRFLELFSHVLGNGSLARASLAVDEDVRRGFPSQGRHQYICEGIDLLLSMRQDLRGIGWPKDVPCLKYPPLVQ